MGGILIHKSVDVRIEMCNASLSSPHPSREEEWMRHTQTEKAGRGGRESWRDTRGEGQT